MVLPHVLRRAFYVANLVLISRVECTASDSRSFALIVNFVVFRGVAVRNSEDELRAFCHEICREAENDGVARPEQTPRNTKGYSSTDLAMGFANVRAGTWYSPEH